ncbi:MAG: ImmA/IrrE family metallo-endopeptidase [Fretibacterium sp.]|mgnify:CR=1 FL=1|nr:ImmA/IrrE family metallo-endopeptidase [Fretibacterium sp.]
MQEMQDFFAVQTLLSHTLPLMKAPPVNLGVVCRFLDVEVYSQPCTAFGAIFVRRRGKGVILVNSSLPQGRARFSIAHELGHFVLRHPPVHSTSFREELERQADCFAAQLLMPRELILHDRLRYDAMTLKRLYKVSGQALEIRLKSLSSMPSPLKDRAVTLQPS